ncbi:hypothetical protein DAT35_18585 [Vitiosangium sp. GDMCC 1.1324]|nr:hypothetical protein DAT35_18585 [Vitiosangium sp. GDMCC 1.1324]
MTAACAAAMASAGCTKSEVDPEATITLTGKVLKEDKQPLANTLLHINRSTNSECIFSFFGGIDWKSVKTSADGSFTQELLGDDTRSGSLARCFELQVPGGGANSYLYAQFLIQSENVQLPTLQQWSGTPSAVAAADGASVSFKDISATQDGVTGEHVLHVETKSSGSVWTVTSAHSPVLLNDDLLEDAADLEAYVSVYRKVEGSKASFTIYNQGETVALPRRSRVPASRGASCTYAGAPATCPLTDGNLSSGASFQQDVREVVIQLPKPKVLRKAVLRNLGMSLTPSELVLEGSSDGTQWVGLANLLEGTNAVRTFIEVPLSNPAPLSHVRLRATSPNSDFRLYWLSELSLFE